MFTAIMEIFALIAHLVTALVRVALPGGVRAVIAESLLLKHQLLVLSRSRNRAPRLTPWDRLLFGIGAFLVAPNRLPKIAIGIKPATLLRFHRALIQRKYRLLFTPRACRRPGLKGPSRPGEFHPEPLTDPCLSLSTHTAPVTYSRLLPSIKTIDLLRLPVDPYDPNADDLLPSLHGRYPASALLLSSPPLPGPSVLSASRFGRLSLFP